MRILCSFAAALLAAGCSAPSVNLSTPEPIKVDISMRLDVYQHSKETAAARTGVTTSPVSEPETRRRNRMADIQNFKNSRLIGENREGLVTVRVDTPGAEGDYVRKTVAAENEDRMALMKAAAVRDKKSLPALQAEQSSLWQKRSFEGELIEVSKPDGTFEWTEKSGR